MMAHLAALGWRGVIPHFRGCGGEPNRHPRAYHSGDHEEIGAMLDAVRARIGTRDGGGPLYAVGVSLGGSALVNWLGRAGRDAIPMVDAAAAVSTPLDLTRCGTAIGQGLNRIYAYHFLWTLLPKSLAMAQRFPGRLDARRIWRVRSMHEFDDVVTAPLHGFKGTADYWHRASSKPWLRQVARAHARDQCAQRSVRAGGLAAGPGRRQRRRGARTARRRRPRRLPLAPVQGKSRLAAAAVGTILHDARLKRRRASPFRVPALARPANLRAPHSNGHPAASFRNLQGLRHSRHRRQDADAADRSRDRPGVGIARTRTRPR